MILHCSRKLAERLPQVSAQPLDEASPLGSWHAHLYVIDRRQCLLFCHDESRYVLFLPGLRKADFAELGRLHRELFLATLAVQGVAGAQLKRVELALGPARFDCATDRSVQSSMRVVRNDLEGPLIRVSNVLELDPVETSVFLSHRPAGARGVDLWPQREMLQRVASL